MRKPLAKPIEEKTNEFPDKEKEIAVKYCKSHFTPWFKQCITKTEQINTIKKGYFK